jgi:hypothetical protein
LLVIALCLPSPAVGAGAWLPVQKLTDADMAAPQVGMFAGGETVATWSAAHMTSGPPQVLTRLPGTPFGPPQPLSGEAGRFAQLALNDAGAAAVSWRGDSTPGEETAWMALRPAGGVFGEPRQVPGTIRAIDRAGNGYVLVLNYPGVHAAELAVATVPPDGSEPAVRVVGQAADIRGPSLAVAPDGTVTVSWAAIRDGETYRDTHVFVATAAPGAAFGDPAIVSSAFHDNNMSGQATRIVSNPRGDALVMWPVLDRVDSSMFAADQTIRGAFRPAGGSFGPEEQVPMPDEQTRGMFRWDAAMGEDGQAVVAWSSLRTVSVTYRPAGGPFEPAQVPPPYPVCCSTQVMAHSDPTVAFDGAGNAAVAYRATTRIEVVRRPRAAGWQAPQSAGDTTANNFDPAIAFDGSGRGIVMWSPQEQSAGESSRSDHGIYAAEYDPSALPRVTRILVAANPRLSLEATDQGRATVVVKRTVRRRLKRVLVKHPAVVPGYNAVVLTKKERRLIAQRGRYVATATVTDSAGRTSPPIRVTFRSPR